MLISAQAKAKAIAAHVEGWTSLSDAMAVAIRTAAPMARIVKTTTAGDGIRNGDEPIVLPLLEAGRELATAPHTNRESWTPPQYGKPPPGRPALPPYQRGAAPVRRP